MRIDFEQLPLLRYLSIQSQDEERHCVELIGGDQVLDCCEALQIDIESLPRARTITSTDGTTGRSSHRVDADES